VTGRNGILTSCQLQGDAVNIRQAAGLLLKNNLKSSYHSIQPSHLQYIKAEVLPCLGSPDFGVRTTVGTIVSVLVQHGGFQSWPEVFQALVQCLDSYDYNHMEGALGALFKV
jgi:transportin-1